ncbi:MAG: class I SAM-dependent methyltransferase [Chloroflexota bacterium]
MPSFIGWVPTPPEFIEGFFELAPVASRDVVYDLGCGDGRLLFTALEKGAGRAVGIDIDPERIVFCREEAKKRNLEDKVTFIQGDVLDVNLSDATVVFCYLINSASVALKPKFEAQLKPGTRVVMESFPVPGWKPVDTFDKDYLSFYLYVIPAEQTS